jgi:membrane protein YdbS with pleckstrin-like domain
MAELLDEPAPQPAAQADAPAGPEGELFHLRPVRRGFLGTMAAGVVFLLATLAVLLWASELGFSKLFSLLPLGFALYMGWRVFVATRSISYRLTSQRLFIQVGLIGRKQEEIELFRITDVAVEQTPMERILKIGSIIVNSTDESLPLARLENLPEPEKYKDLLRNAYRQARTREGMRAGEFIGGMG